MSQKLYGAEEVAVMVISGQSLLLGECEHLVRGGRKQEHFCVLVFKKLSSKVANLGLLTIS